MVEVLVKRQLRLTNRELLAATIADTTPQLLVRSRGITERHAVNFATTEFELVVCMQLPQDFFCR